MKIIDTIIRPNGMVETREIEVNDNYFDGPASEVQIAELRATAVTEIEKATTIASLRAAMLKYVNAGAQ